MIIVEGKNQKSVKLVEYLNNNKENCGRTVLIDYVGVSSLQGDFDHYCINGLDEMTPLTIVDDFTRWHKSFKHFDTVALYVNAPTEMIEKLKELDSNFPQNFIATIQNNEIEEVIIYEI